MFAKIERFIRCILWYVRKDTHYRFLPQNKSRKYRYKISPNVSLALATLVLAVFLTSVTYSVSSCQWRLAVTLCDRPTRPDAADADGCLVFKFEFINMGITWLAPGGYYGCCSVETFSSYFGSLWKYDLSFPNIYISYVNMS